MCTPRVSKGAPSDALWVHAEAYGLWKTYSLSCKPAWGKYRACRTHICGPQLCGPKIVGSPSLKAVHAHCSAMGYTGPKITKKSYKPAAQSSDQSDQGLIYTLNWQTRTKSFFIRTGESNQTELGAHAISVLSCTGSHISCCIFS